MKVTIEAVAKAAGVSKTAVSFVLNNRLPQANAISKETRERILACANSLGYKKNPIAASLRTGTPLWIGVLAELLLDSPDRWVWAPPFELSLLLGVQTRLSEGGYFTLLGSRSGSDEVESLDLLASAGVGGLIVKSAGEKAVELANKVMQSSNIPVVNVFPVGQEDLYPYIVDLDNLKAGQMAGEMLIKAEAKIPMCVTREPSLHMVKNRTKGFCESIREHMSSEPLVCELPADLDEAASVEALAKFIQSARPDAILATEAGLSVIASIALDTLGLETPKDIAVIGFDCYSFLTRRGQKISSVGSSWWQAGRIAAEMVIESISSRTSPSAPTMIDPLFMPGDSTPPELALEFSRELVSSSFETSAADIRDIVLIAGQVSRPPRG